MKLVPFSTEVVCPKCGNDKMGWFYFDHHTNTISSIGRLIPGEHLRITCEICQFKIAMKCKDAIQPANQEENAA